MSRPLSVLCLDIEGGYGGSSRSLYYLLKHMDRTRVAPVVWCKRAGPIQAMYAALGITTRVMSEMPKVSALPRLSRNAYQLALHAKDWVKAREALIELAEEARRHDVVHFNHEALATLALWLRRKASRPQSLHIRTNVQPSFVARAQMRAISRAVDQVAFITCNEEATFRSLGGTAPGRVIFNVIEPGQGAMPHADVPRDGRLVVASIANAAWVRGTDRLVELAAVLRERRRDDVVFVVAGEMGLKGQWPGELAQDARSGITLEEAVRRRGLERAFVFLGHVPDPERVLAASDLLIKPTREDNPWGRDVLEAMASGKPVLSVGADQTFVETGVTGVLQREFDAQALANILGELAADRARLGGLGRAARERVSRLCSGPDRAHDLAELWLSVAGRA